MPSLLTDRRQVNGHKLLHETIAETHTYLEHLMSQRLNLRLSAAISYLLDRDRYDRWASVPADWEQSGRCCRCGNHCRDQDIGLDEYEVRTWLGWQHHITMVLLAGAFLLDLQLDCGKKAVPDHSPLITQVLRQLLPQRTWTPEQLWHWLTDTQFRNEQAKRSHAARRRLRGIHPSL